jgi:two-component system, NarL family, nitrate/nitrite response regulator NarL
MRGLRISIVDDHPVMLEGLSSILKEKISCDIDHLGVSAADIGKIIAKNTPDIMIIDLNMPGDAFKAIEDATAAAPQMKIIVFTASDSTDHAIRSLEAGASGYVVKGSSVSELIEAIESVSEGVVHITPGFMSKVLSTLQHRALQRKEAQHVNLSFRETQVMQLLLGGKSNKEIAAALTLSEKTVKGYMTHLMQKLHARNRVEVVIAAQKLNTASTVSQHVGR